MKPMSPKLHLSSNQIAILALGVSVLSAAGNVYQWWISGRQELIKAAIDLSSRYDDQAVDETMLIFQLKEGLVNDPLDNSNKVQGQQARRQYIEFLADQGLINSKYLSQRIICDITQLDNGGTVTA